VSVISLSLAVKRFFGKMRFFVGASE